jgi:hypothetical protein
VKLAIGVGSPGGELSCSASVSPGTAAPPAAAGGLSASVVTVARAELALGTAPLVAPSALSPGRGSPPAGRVPGVPTGGFAGAALLRGTAAFIGRDAGRVGAAFGFVPPFDFVTLALVVVDLALALATTVLTFGLALGVALGRLAFALLAFGRAACFGAALGAGFFRFAAMTA